MANRVTENAERDREIRRGDLSEAKKGIHETDTMIWTITSVWRAGGRAKQTLWREYLFSQEGQVDEASQHTKRDPADFSPPADLKRKNCVLQHQQQQNGWEQAL